MVFLNNAFSYTGYRHTPTMLSICLVIAVIFYDYTDSGKCGRMLRGYDTGNLAPEDRAVNL